MRNRRIECVVLGILWPLMGQSSELLAALPYPITWSRVSTDHRFILVMISPNDIDEEIGRYPERQAKIQELRTKYPQCGMYLNDGSIAPLWICEYWDGYGFGGESIIAPDGDHVIRQGGWTYDAYDSCVVEFTYRGQGIRRYFDVDMIPQYVLKRILNGLSPITCTETRFDPNKMQYTVRTNQGEEYDFDAGTGNVVAVRSPFPTLYAICASASIAIVVAIVIRQLRKHRIPGPG